MISSELAKRVVTGIPLAAVAVWYIFGANQAVFAGLTILIGFLGLWEYGNALANKKILISKSILYGSLIVVCLAAWAYLAGDSHYTLLLMVGLLGVMGAFSLSTVAREEKRFLWYLFPLAWILGPLVLVYFIRFQLLPGRGSQLIFLVIVVAAFNDICAYFGGRKFGKHHMTPRISPNKTVEGHLFGIAGGLIPGLIMTHLWLTDLLPIWKAVPIFIVLIISAQAGDLIESKFKRYCGVKDSSNLIPGHGGILDRIDAYLLALPVFIGLLYIFNVIV